MRLYEYEAKEIFKRYGIPIPQGWVARTPEEVRDFIVKLNRPAVLKAQVLFGSRVRIGGIKFVESPEEAEKVASQLFRDGIMGYKINKLLVEEKLDVARELYLGITIDTTHGSPIIMASSEGGIEIEEIAARFPEKIAVFRPDVLKGLREYEARRLAKQIGLGGSMLLEVSRIICRLYAVFKAYDAEIAEINPLAITADGKVIAVDARLNIDDHALYRHPDLEALIAEHFENPLEYEGQKRGVNFVELKGNIAVMGNGAGLVMTLLDAIKMAGGQPACFLDTGGGLSADRIERALDLILMKAEKDPEVRAIFFAFWFMISPAEEVIEGFLNIMSRRKPRIPIIGVIQGVGADQAIEALETVGIKCYPTIREGIEAAVGVV